MSEAVAVRTEENGGAAEAVSPRLRDASVDDLPAIERLVRGLASYERLEHEVRATQDDLRQALFGPQPRVFALICEWEGRPVGLCIWFYNFSTFLGRHGIYIEDIFVEPEHRGRGIGRAVFRHLARRAVAEGCGRLEWSVLNWNEPAIGFYRGIGAQAMTDWHIQRVTGDALRELADRA